MSNHEVTAPFKQAGTLNMPKNHHIFSSDSSKWAWEARIEDMRKKRLRTINFPVPQKKEILFCLATPEEKAQHNLSWALMVRCSVNPKFGEAISAQLSEGIAFKLPQIIVPISFHRMLGFTAGQLHLA